MEIFFRVMCKKNHDFRSFFDRDIKFQSICFKIEQNSSEIYNHEKTTIFIEAKSGQFFYFYDQIQVTQIVHLTYYNMYEFCTMIPISLFITKIQNLK
jgi:hypothetical protein